MQHQCFECKKVYKPEIHDGWWMDDLRQVKCRDGSPSIYYDICDECRTKNAKEHFLGSYKCSRCWKSGEPGLTKWNINRGHVINYTFDGDIFCYDCNGLIYYNK